MGERCDVTLAAGLWRDDRCQREVSLRALPAPTRRTLVDDLRDRPPAARVSGLLAALVESIGDVRDPSLDDVRDLTIGDRDRIVLAIRRALVGGELECVFGCPCGETLELAVRVDTLLGEAPAEPAPRRADRAAVAVRAATGGDHERAGLQAAEDAAAAARGLVTACVLEPRAVDDDVLEVASELLEGLDPGAELLLRGTCPACASEVVAQLDPGAYLWTELDRWRARLEREVHVLASRYHWSEADIVALDPARRARYLELLDEDAAPA